MIFLLLMLLLLLHSGWDGSANSMLRLRATASSLRNCWWRDFHRWHSIGGVITGEASNSSHLGGHHFGLAVIPLCWQETATFKLTWLQDTLTTLYSMNIRSDGSIFSLLDFIIVLLYLKA